MKPSKTETLAMFWDMYDHQGAVPAITWLKSLEYYEEYCKDDLTSVIDKIQNDLKI